MLIYRGTMHHNTWQLLALLPQKARRDFLMGLLATGGIDAVSQTPKSIHRVSVS